MGVWIHQNGLRPITGVAKTRLTAFIKYLDEQNVELLSSGNCPGQGHLMREFKSDFHPGLLCCRERLFSSWCLKKAWCGYCRCDWYKDNQTSWCSDRQHVLEHTLDLLPSSAFTRSLRPGGAVFIETPCLIMNINTYMNHMFYSLKIYSQDVLRCAGYSISHWPTMAMSSKTWDEMALFGNVWSN